MLEVVELPVDDVQPYHKNPRKGDVGVIAESLSVNGQYRPIVVNVGTLTGRKNEVLAGNHTLLAARSLGWSSIQATMLDVDEVSAARIVAADNRTSDLGGYDNTLLAELLEAVATDSLAGSGYSDDDLDALLEEVRPSFQPEDDEDVRLDRKSVTTCPNCGHEFKPVTRSVTYE